MARKRKTLDLPKDVVRDFETVVDEHMSFTAEVTEAMKMYIKFKKRKQSK